MAQFVIKLLPNNHNYLIIRHNNLYQAKIDREEKEYIPITMKAGISYHPFEKLILTLETEKQLQYKPSYRSGLEYAIIEKFKVRAGCSLHPFINYFGAGFKDKRISFDYALSRHPVLGISQQLSITYILTKKNEK